MPCKYGTWLTTDNRIAELRVEYEQQPEYALQRIENAKEQLNWRVEKMRLAGIPAEAYEYKLGNKSALHWVIDQYQVSVDKRSGIENDPNRLDDPEYIVRLVGQVVTVSVETVAIVKGLPEWVVE